MSYPPPPPPQGSDPYGVQNQPGQQPVWPPQQPTEPYPAQPSYQGQQSYQGPDQGQWQQGDVPPYGGPSPIPPAQPPKKHTGLKVAGGVVGGLIVVGLIGNALGGDTEDEAPPAADPTTQVEEVTTDPEPAEEATSTVATVEVGECVNSADLSVTGITEIPTVPCTDEHDAQVIGKFDMADGAFPGEDGVASAAGDGCRTAFMDFIGVSYDDSPLAMNYVGPTQETWEQANDREVICFAVTDDGGIVTTSWAADAEPETAEETTEPAEAEPTEAEPELTLSQQNAIGTARDYLEYTGFSRSGLIDQLEYEGYSTEDATFAVDYLDVDWNEQAVVVAENYLDYSGFSRSGLIGQLEYEGFSASEAEYGVSNITVDWNEQAAIVAQNYLDYSNFSRQELLDQLLFEGFTQEQAEYGVEAVGY